MMRTRPKPPNQPLKQHYWDDTADYHLWRREALTAVELGQRFLKAWQSQQAEAQSRPASHASKAPAVEPVTLPNRESCDRKLVLCTDGLGWVKAGAVRESNRHRVQALCQQLSALHLAIREILDSAAGSTREAEVLSGCPSPSPDP